jgi:FKBP-type peptidyl-prolyl cis-trans isomerase FklB
MEANRAYLADNAKKPGVTTTDSGLQYRVIREGDGRKPSGPSAEVEVHYRGSLIDGTVFDASYDGDEPGDADRTISFFLHQVIDGWTEGLQLMPVGSTYEFTIPHELAYGTSGAPPDIPKFATLIFVVHLVNVY